VDLGLWCLTPLYVISLRTVLIGGGNRIKPPTNSHDITEILLKGALNTIKPLP
jgi:hypothetical protein